MVFGFQVNQLEAQNTDYSHELDSILGIDYLFKETIDPIEEQYKLYMTKANGLYKEQKFAEAVVYFRKALKTKPDERLPQYKIEDVYTLFLINDVVKTKEEAKRLVAEVEMSLDNIDNEELFIQKSTDIEVISERIIIENTIVEENIIEQKLKPEIIQPTLGVESKLVAEIAKIDVREIETEKIKSIEIIENREVKQKIPKVIEQKIIPEISEPKQASVSVAEEMTLLLAQYPNEKTVKITEDANKTTTKIVINRDGHVVIYTKIKHSWGGIFFFAKYASIPIKNISELHFTQSTQD